MTKLQKARLEIYLKFILPTLENNNIEKGYLWVQNPNTDFKRQLFFNTYAEGIELIEKYQHNNVYIGLATTISTDYKTECLLNRNVIIVDIDEQNLEISDIYERCKKIGLFCHLVVNSGRGWHLYFKLEGTYAIKDIVEVNRYITGLFNADLNACSSTQIIRVPFTKNYKNNKYASIISSDNPINGYNLNTLKNHKIIEFKKSDDVFEFNNVKDLYCFNELLKYGASKGARNISLMFLSTTCKYCHIDESKALQYAYEFNNNCSESLSKNEVKKVVKSIYSNMAFIKPCTTNFGQSLCNNMCPCKYFNTSDIITINDVNIDNKVVGLTNKHILSYQRVGERGLKRHMLEILTGTELNIMALLKVCYPKFFTVDDISDFLEVSKPTISKYLKSLKSKDIIFSTKQRVERNDKPTEFFTYNFDFEKYNQEIVHLNTNLFTSRMQKNIKDSDLKVAIALRYLVENRMRTTFDDISNLTGIDSTNISKNLNNLKKAKLVVIEKNKTSSGVYNSYRLFY